MQNVTEAGTELDNAKAVQFTYQPLLWSAKQQVYFSESDMEKTR